MNSLQSSSHLQQEHELHASGHRRNRRNAYNPANIMFFVPAQNSTTLQCCIKFRSSKDFLQNATQMQQKKLRFAFSHHGYEFIVKPSLHFFSQNKSFFFLRAAPLDFMQHVSEKWKKKFQISWFAAINNFFIFFAPGGAHVLNTVHRGDR